MTEILDLAQAAGASDLYLELDTPLNIELSQWKMLSRGLALEFYREMLTEDAVMAVPAPQARMTKTEVLREVSAAPAIEEYLLFELDIQQLTTDVNIISYRMFQKRTNQMGFYAAISTMYQKIDDSWKIVYHQQTPLRN